MQMRCKLCALLSVICIMCMFCSCKSTSWNKNNFGSYFSIDTFDMSIEDVINREEETFKITEFQRNDEEYGTFLIFNDMAVERHYMFDVNTGELLYIHFYTAENFLNQFRISFGDAEVKNGLPFWYGYIGEEKIMLMGGSNTVERPWGYGLGRYKE